MHADKRRWRKLVAVLSCAVALTTAYILIMPAVTLTGNATCGLEEHAHTSDCYTQTLTCGQEESSIHTHSDECYTNTLTCGKEEHAHDESCYMQRAQEAGTEDASTKSDTSTTQEAHDISDHLTTVKFLKYNQVITEDEIINTEQEIELQLGFTGLAGKNGIYKYSYTLPADIALPDNVESGTLTEDGDVKGTYSFAKDETTGQWTITFDMEPDYVMANDYISINMQTYVLLTTTTSGSQEIDFGNGQVVKVLVDAESKLGIEKSHWSSGETPYESTYWISVNSTSANSDIYITDTITGQEVTFTDADGVTHTKTLAAKLKVGSKIEATTQSWEPGSSKVSVLTKDVTENYTLNDFIAEVNALKIDLPASTTFSIDYVMEYDADTRFLSDTYGFDVKTTNVATVKSTEVTDEFSSQTSWTYISNKANIISKSGELDGTSAKWDMTVNDGAYIPMAGQVLYDSLQSEKLSYDTNNPFVINVYEADGTTLVRTDTITDWSNNTQGLTLSADGKSWEYTVPASDGENKYVYKISYYTNVTEPDGQALHNNAGARFTQYPSGASGNFGTETTGEAGELDLGIVKTGEVIDQDNKIVEWTVKFTVYPNSVGAQNLKFVDYLPSYSTETGETKYSILIDENGNGPTEADLASAEAFTAFCKNGNVYSMTVAEYNSGADLSNNANFAFLANFTNSITTNNNSEVTDVYLLGSDGQGVYFPGAQAVGSVNDGYVVTVKYRTKSSDIAYGQTVTNKVYINYDDLYGDSQWMGTPARVGFEVEDQTGSVPVEKTGTYDEGTNKVHYVAKIDSAATGFIGANSITVVDNYDPRMSFAGEGFTLYATVNGNRIPFVLEFSPGSHKSAYNSPALDTYTEVTQNEDGTTSYHITCEGCTFKARGQGTADIPFEVTITADTVNHTVTGYYPYIYYELNGADGTRIDYIDFELDYYTEPVDTSRVKTDITNTITVTGDNSVVYGEDTCVLSFGESLLKKEIKDSVDHTHSYGACYTTYSDLSNTLTCPLDAENEKNTVLFNIKLSFSDELLDLNELMVIDDFMDLSCLTPDLSKARLRYVNSKSNGYTAIDFTDVCEACGITDADFDVRMVATGLSANINMGTLNGGKVDARDLCTAWLQSDFAQSLTNNGIDPDLKNWTLEFSYPCEVHGNLGETISVVNKANLRGIDDTSTEVSLEKVIQVNGGTVSGQSFTLTLQKLDAEVIDATVKQLQGAVYNLCDENGNVLASGTTDENGQIVFGSKGTEGAGKFDMQPYTAYYLQETTAPTGYILDSSKKWFYMTAPASSDAANAFTPEEEARLAALGCEVVDMEYTGTLYNSSSAKLTLKKVDTNTGNVLVGAEFALYNDAACTSLFYRGRTVGAGTTYFNALELGQTYYLKETAAPEGYEVDSTVHEVTVSNAGVVSVDGLSMDEDGATYLFPNGKASYELPATGGIGTVVFTTGGSLLIAGGLYFKYRSMQAQGRGVHSKRRRI